MKKQSLNRLLSCLLCLALCLSWIKLSASAADEIWRPEPTHWQHSSHVHLVEKNGYALNWGVRDEACRFMGSGSYYPELVEGSRSDGWLLDVTNPYEPENSFYPGGTGADDAAQSPLYQYIRAFLQEKQTRQTTASEARSLLRYTDCMVSDSAHMAAFFSGRKLNCAWDNGQTWKIASIWPEAKASGGLKTDIMALRPVSVSEDAARGSKAYGVSSGYYDPDQGLPEGFSVKGDVARILLYCYVRWNDANRMWGKDGVIESVDVLLDWIEQDPVDTWEMARNDAVESITGARNCFVDYPELAFYLFGRSGPSWSTPWLGEHNNFDSAPAQLDGESSDESLGTVMNQYWALKPVPAAGCYVSDFRFIGSGGTFSDWITGAEYSFGMGGELRWEYGRLLYFPHTEFDIRVQIRFLPIGDPAPATVDLGKTATFRVTAAEAVLGYQWQYQKFGETEWHNWAGKTAQKLTVTGSATNTACKYRCVVTTAAGSFPSKAATLTVNGAPIPPSVTSQPAAAKAKLGETVSFLVGAKGSGLSYQWQYSKDNGAHWQIWSGKTAAALSVKASATNNGCLYRCEVKNSLGSVLSRQARLTVTDAQPNILTQPQNASVDLGNTVTLKVAVGGAGLTYQWQYKKAGDSAWRNWSGKTAASLTITGSKTNDGCSYRCVVQNSAGNVNSSAARLTVTGMQPTILNQPQDVSVPLGKAVILRVAADGAGLTYQWQYKKVGDTAWRNWSGQTSAAVTVVASETNNCCLYRCIVKNSCAAVTSEPAKLTVRQQSE